MKIERDSATLEKPQTIQAFAEQHDLTMRVRRRTDDGTFWAYFKDSEIRSGCFRMGISGEGRDEDGAIADYATRISGRDLVVRGHQGRRDIRVPYLTSEAT